jgi:acyl-CoA thioester hydrolase
VRRPRRWPEPPPRFLAASTQVRVRFQEVDSLRVVWHGHYLTYFEDGRNAFGRRYGLGYRDILAAGYIAPLVHLEIDYFQAARYDQLLEVETRMHDDPGARIHLTYTISDATTGTTLATGRSVQVFTDPEGELILTQPRFHAEFRSRWAAGFRDA